MELIGYNHSQKCVEQRRATEGLPLPATTSLDSLSSSMNVDLAHLKNRYMDSFAKVPENSSSISMRDYAYNPDTITTPKANTEAN